MLPTRRDRSVVESETITMSAASATLVAEGSTVPPAFFRRCLVAGAMSMAAGEYVSVSSQADTEAADIARERAELASDPEFEHRELAAIYQKRGLDEETSDKVASQLMASDALAAHARDELSITHMTAARPIQAASSSGSSRSACRKRSTASS